MNGSRNAAHFARIYQSNPDPWGFQTDPYEQSKYQHSIEMLDGAHFTSGLEVGCSIGVLTRMLAPSCDSLLAVDIVEAPLTDAASRCADQPWVRFQCMTVPDTWPPGRFDLIVLSEVLYFLSPKDIDRCATKVLTSVSPDARILLVNWLGQSDDPCSGDQAASRFIEATKGAMQVVRQERREKYRVDLLTTTSGCRG